MVACSPYLAFEADIGFDFELLPRSGKPVGKVLPRVHGEHHAKVRDRHGVSVDGVVMNTLRTRCTRLQVRDDLVTEEVEVDPMLRTAAFGAAEQTTIESTRRSEIVDRKCDVKRRQGQWRKASCGDDNGGWRAKAAKDQAAGRRTTNSVLPGSDVK